MERILIQPYNTPMAPCGVCEMHTATCHSSCEKYREYRKQIDAGKKEKKKSREGYLYAYMNRLDYKDRKCKEKKHKSQYWGLCGGRRK